MTDRPEFVVKTDRLLAAHGVLPGWVHVRNGRIAGLSAREPAPIGIPVVDAGGLVVMAGLVDTHVHVNEPGRTDWEGFDTATRAAAAGGVTTIVDMPLNSIPATTTVQGLRAKRAAAEGCTWVDTGFWGGVVPGNVDELEPLAREGVLGFKCFLVPSGVDEFRHVTGADLEAALNALAALRRVLLVHAELPGPIERAQGSLEREPRRYANYLASRPDESEEAAIELVTTLALKAGAAIHIVHLSSSRALDTIREARQRGVRLSVETCPHYLFFCDEQISDGATAFKCAPPIRSAANRDALWEAVREGSIQLIASDHSPSPPALKRVQDGDFRAAWGGIASLELGLSAVWTMAEARGFSLGDVARLMSDRPAELAGLGGQKGRLALGYDADLIAWDPDCTFIVDQHRLHQRHPLTPYDGATLRGRVEMTFVRGVKVYDRGTFGSGPQGMLLERRA
jgi:allantoinase